MMLHTAHDREVRRLRLEIQKLGEWMRVDANGRRAMGFHKSKLKELQTELEKLQEST